MPGCAATSVTASTRVALCGHLARGWHGPETITHRTSPDLRKQRRPRQDSNLPDDGPRDQRKHRLTSVDTYVH